MAFTTDDKAARTAALNTAGDLYGSTSPEYQSAAATRTAANVDRALPERGSGQHRISPVRPARVPTSPDLRCTA